MNKIFVFPFLLLGFPALAQAQDLSAADTSWVMVSTALVLMMTLPGLALFYGGLVRRKNVLSILMQCFTIACLASTLWALVLYGLSFGDGHSLQKIIGLSKFFMSGIGLNAMSGTLPESVFFMFQMTFAIITPALIIGAFAERMKFSAVLWFSGLWLIVVYAPICHWVWGGGWLGDLGFLDFAGGSVVHINAGIAALVATLVIGRRVGFPDVVMTPHNMTLAVMGASMLWVGWFGFNAGSALAANQNAGMAILVTHISAALGSLVWMTCEWIKYGKPSVLGIVTGMVAGLGAVTPASGFIGPFGAFVIGATAGLLCYFATQYMKRKLKIDDSLDVFSVHGVGGIVGTLLVAVLAVPALGGLGLERSIFAQLGVQITGIIATILWCGIWTFVLLKLIDKFLGGLRVSQQQEEKGLDLSEHDESGYSL